MLACSHYRNVSKQTTREVLAGLHEIAFMAGLSVQLQRKCSLRVSMQSGMVGIEKVSQKPDLLDTEFPCEWYLLSIGKILLTSLGVFHSVLLDILHNIITACTMSGLLDEDLSDLISVR
ncbi:hypothetical protein Tco_1109398 [Tanacetum coccineum]